MVSCGTINWHPRLSIIVTRSNSIYDIDLEDVSAEQIAELKAAKKSSVISQLEAGESWRQDSTDFDERDLGHSPVARLPSPNVHEIMRRRIAAAKTL